MEQGKTGSKRMNNNFEVDSKSEFFDKLSDVVMLSMETVKDEKQVYKNKKLYFAGPWFDERSKILYTCCETISNICCPYSEYKVFFPKQQTNETPLEAFNKNVRNIEDCDLVVALVSKKDCGTAWEIGMAYALKKPVILLGYDETTFLSHTNVMLAFTGKCTTIDQLANIFLSKDFKEVEIKNEWEGIE